MRPFALRATVFFSGAVILAVEVMAVRILSPYFGNTIFNFSSVISVILAALSAGYWYGGRLADRRPAEELFYKLVAISGASILVSYAAASYLLPAVGSAMPVTIGPLISALSLFFGPGFLFGLLSPFVIKLACVFAPEKGVGTVAGEIFFFSTLGSIAGSLAAGFWLIPSYGISSSMVVMGAGMIAIGSLGMALARGSAGHGEAKRAGILLFVVALGAATLIGAAPPVYSDVVTLYEEDGVYGNIVVADGEYKGERARMLFFDRSLSSAVFIDKSDRLPFEYMNFFTLYRVFDPAPEKILVLGGATGAVPKLLLAKEPRATITSVEIEPSLPALGREFFNVPPDPRLTDVIADGRRFLADHPDNFYDVIIGDAFHSFYSIPWHMATEEFYEMVYDQLDPGGVYLMNVISMFQPEHPTMLFPTIATMQKVFDEVHVFDVQTPGTTDPKNFTVIGVKGKSGVVFPDALSSSDDAFLRTLATHYIPPSRYEPLHTPVLTDDYAPTDSYTGALLVASEFRTE